MKRLSLITISLLFCVNFASADMDSQLQALKSAQEEGEYQERAAINRAAKAAVQREKQRQAALKAEEFVAEDLNHAKATTDNIQAKSDAIRSNPRSGENYLIKSGETDVKK